MKAHLSPLFLGACLVGLAACGAEESANGVDASNNVAADSGQLNSSPDLGFADAGFDDAGAALDAATGMDAAAAMDAAMQAACASAATEGWQEGRRPPARMLTTCDGQEVDLRSYCGKPLYMLIYADWCPRCRQKAEGLQARADAVPGVQTIMVISENSRFESPTAEQCATIKQRYGLNIPVFRNQSGWVKRAGLSSNDFHVVMDSDQIIRFRGHYQNQSAVDTAINNVVGK